MTLRMCWILGCCLGWGTVGAAEPAAVRVAWKTGPAFRQQLEAPLGVTWAHNPLRQALQNLARDRQVAILLDRRVDPDQAIDFTSNDQPLEAMLQQLAASLGIGVSYVSDVVYLGPPDTAAVLATVAAQRRDEAARLPDAQRRGWLQPSAAAWTELSTPRELLQRLAQSQGTKLANPETIPHDLWPAQDFPPLVPPDQLSLILAGFSQTFQWDDEGRTLRFIDMPKRPQYEREYALPGEPTQVLSQLRTQFPEVAVQLNGRRVRVQGLYEDHERLERFLRGDRVTKRTVVSGEKRFSLNVQNQPLGSVLRALRDGLKLQIEFAPGAQDQLKTLVTFQTKDVTLDELLEAALEPAGLRFQWREKTLFVELRP